MMKRLFPARTIWALLAGTAVAALPHVMATAQNPFLAPTEAMDTLNEGPVGPTGAGQVGLNRARNVQQQAPAPYFVPQQGQQRPQAPAAGFNAQAAAQQAQQEAEALARRILKKRTKVITGTRVFDAITNVLIDDAKIRMVPEEEKDNYFDDGTHGDPVAEDGEYALVEERSDVIGQANQRKKERLIQALYDLELMDPLEFYGFSLMTTEQFEHPERRRRWTMVEENRRAPSLRLTEVESDRPLEMPNFRNWEEQKDQKIAGEGGWAFKFLDEYREVKGDLNSEFYPMYIPQPPVPPAVPPPTDAGWQPFPNPDKLRTDEGNRPAGPGGAPRTSRAQTTALPTF